MQNNEAVTLKRLRLITVFFLLLGVLFLAKLFQRQILMFATYDAQARKQYYTTIDKPAKRGEILIHDRDNSNLINEEEDGLFSVATDLELFNVLAVPRHIENKEEASQKLSEVLDINKDDIYNEINCDKWYVPPIKKKIDKETADKVESLGMKGVYVEGEYFRFYPENNFLSQVLGFTNYDGDGKYGVEGYYDGILKGEGGELKGIKDNLGRVVQVEESEPGKDGSSIVLTIDRSIQYMAEKKLNEGIERYGAEGGSIVIADPSNGDILAMASSPNFNPNTFNEVPTEDQGLFVNPVTGGNWEPGSIFKPIIVAGAIKDKKVEPDSTPEDPFDSFVEVDGYKIRNALEKPYGYESVTQILENSDNVGMVWIGNKVGNDLMGRFIETMGFGEKTGVDIAGESPGQVPKYSKWRDVNRATITFGQGISVTPLQIVRAYSAIANDGKMAGPHLLDKIIEKGEVEKTYDQDDPVEVMSKEDAMKVQEMLVSVVENGHGKPAKVDGYRVAGKTGTAQVAKSEGGYEDDKFIGSFAGFAPVDDPRFVMLVKFDKPSNVKWAEESAAPIFGEIADWLLNSYLKVPKQDEASN